MSPPLTEDDRRDPGVGGALDTTAPSKLVSTERSRGIAT